MEIIKNEKKSEKPEKKRVGFIKGTLLTAVTACILLNPQCGKNISDREYDKEKQKMINVMDQQENFSRLVETNIKTINGKKYEILRFGTKAVLEYKTDFAENILPLEIDNTGKAHLTANKNYAYIMLEEGQKLIRVDTRNKTQRTVDLESNNTNISLSSDDNYVFLYSKEKGLLIMDKELNNYKSINLRQVENIEGKISNLFLNKSSRGLMFVGNNFGSIYFYKIDKNGNYDLSRLKLQHEEKFQNPRIVEYEGKYYIKPENKEKIYEFDGNTGKLLREMDMPKEEKNR
jgi:hypothetical protein